MLQRYKQQQVDKASQYIKDIKALKAVKGINWDVAQLEDGLMPGTLALDQSAFMPSVLEGDLGFPSLKNTRAEAASSS